MDTEPPASPSSLLAFPYIFLITQGPDSIAGPLLFLLLLLIASALISGSEVAFFSLDNNDTSALDEEGTPVAFRILRLIQRPQQLLGTILVANNLINIAIVVISAWIISSLLPSTLLSQWAECTLDVIPVSWVSIETLANLYSVLITTVFVTAILVLFGEVAPKIYANQEPLKMARFMSRPLSMIQFILSPISTVLVKSSRLLTDSLESHSGNQNTATREDIDKAIELTVTEGSHSDEEKEILKGIVNFSEVSVKQVMRNRTDVIAISSELSIEELITLVRDNGYSRLPVYNEDIDNLRGIFYVKDLIGQNLQKLNWPDLIRDSILYVPESKKLNELLREFQLSKTHMAVVVDEFGGTAGLLTLEDILEEVVGDIKDEFDDDEEVDFLKIDDRTYIFDGKTLINDFCRVLDLTQGSFDKLRGEADSLAGLFLENTGTLPKLNREFYIAPCRFKIIAVNKRRIQQIKVTLDQNLS